MELGDAKCSSEENKTMKIQESKDGCPAEKHVVLIERRFQKNRTFAHFEFAPI